MAWEWYEDLPKDVEAHIKRVGGTAQPAQPAGDLSSPSRFPFRSIRDSVDFEDRRDVPHTRAGTPPSAFESLANTHAHLKHILAADNPEPTIVVGGKKLPASHGFGAKVTFRAG